MAHKKKKPDCLVAGVLALLTAFSPVVSVIPTYAASDNEMSTSVTIDNDPKSRLICTKNILQELHPVFQDKAGLLM